MVCAIFERRPSGAISGVSLPALAVALAALLFPSTTAAQISDAASASNATEDAPSDTAGNKATGGAGDIVVSGTRLVRDGYNAPTPVTVLGSEQIEAAAATNIADTVNQLPALAGSSQPRTAQVGIGGGTAGANFMDLRRLGNNRTLVLLNGRRVAPAATTGAVDVNTLPSGLIKRVDVVTGGASAAWGSDAVAGVVNFVLDTDFTGIKLQAQAGITSEGDNPTRLIEASAGHSFADGRGHILVSGQYSFSGPAMLADRDWYQGWKIVNNPAFATGNGQPARLVAPDVQNSRATDGGLITAGPLMGTQFGPDGSPRPFTYGLVTGNFMIGGGGEDLSRIVQLNPRLEIYNVFGAASYSITDNVEVFSEFSYGNAKVRQQSAPYFRFGNVTIRNDNPYLDPVTRARLTAAGQTSFAFGTTNANLGNTVGLNDRELIRGLAGLKGNFAGVNWEIYYQRGKSKVRTAAVNNANTSRFAAAADAVLNSSGVVVCRSTLLNPGNGCVPLNMFGEGKATSEAIAYINGSAVQNLRLTQDVASAELSGEPFSTWAGPVSIVVGGEYRKEYAVGDADAVSIANGWFVGNYKPFFGEYDVREAFAEAVVPLLRDSALGDTLDLNAAVRLTDYSTSGTVTTWKFGLSYEPVADLRFRLTASRDIRAPNLNDLFLGGQVNTQTASDPFNGNQNIFFLRIQQGNPDLQPEIAKTFAAGVVYSPGFLPGLSASLDIFKIKIDGAITTLTNQQIVDRCFAGDQLLCDRITRNAAGAITELVSQPLNIQSEKLSGADIDVSYRTGDLSFRAIGSYVHKFELANGVLSDRRAGEIGGLPRWRWVASATWNADPVSLTLRSRFISAMKLENDWGPLDVDRNKVNSRLYFDVFSNFKIASKAGAEFFLAVENILDKDPPVAPTASALPIDSQPAYYDTLGRQFRAGVRFRF